MSPMRRNRTTGRPAAWTDGRADMVTFRSYGAARDSLVRELLEDASAHQAGRFDEIGRRFGRIELPNGGPPGLTKLRVALSFRAGWIDARNRGWHPAGNIAKTEWPMLARRIASDLADDREISDARVSARFNAAAGGVRTALGIAYVAAFVVAASLAFFAFEPTGVFALVPTALWLAPGLRARVRRAGNVTDGVVGWPGLTGMVCGASSLAMMALGGRGMAAAWLASVAACGVLEVVRARVAEGDNLRAESRSHGPRPW
jgi:hypothetical protein